MLECKKNIKTEKDKNKKKKRERERKMRKNFSLIISGMLMVYFIKDTF